MIQHIFTKGMMNWFCEDYAKITLESEGLCLL